MIFATSSSLTVTVPAGAVTGPATVEVTPEPPHDGGLARFRLEAPGLVEEPSLHRRDDVGTHGIASSVVRRLAEGSTSSVR